METKHCLNCEEIVEKKFCSNCGQKADMHRITFKHFLMHDILHGVWHVERGILFTIKEVLTRPGKAAIDYISGKRIKYYNFFYLTVIVIGFFIFLSDYYDDLSFKYTAKVADEVSQGQIVVTKLYDKYSKIFILAFIPFFAFFSYFIFKRPKYNLSEHLIIGGICFLGISILTNIGILLSCFEFTTHFEWIAIGSYYIIPTSLFIYIYYCYYTAFSSYYSKMAIFWRTTVFVIILPSFVLGLLKLIFTYIKQLYN